MKVSVSLLAADLSTRQGIQRALAVAEEGKADFIHIDTMDGKFVENTTIFNDPKVIAKLKTKVPLDVHIMIENPQRRIQEFIDAGASILSFHAEVAHNISAISTQLRKAGVKPGLAVNIDTPLEEVIPLLKYVDLVLIMGIMPGASGRKFDETALEKISFIHNHYPEILISVDGGVKLSNAQEIADAGADILVASSAIFKSPNPVQVIKEFKKVK